MILDSICILEGHVSDLLSCPILINSQGISDYGHYVGGYIIENLWMMLPVIVTLVIGKRTIQDIVRI